MDIEDDIEAANTWAQPVHPKTKAGIALINAVIRMILSRAVEKLSSLFSSTNKSPTDNTIIVPDYGKQVTG